MWFQEGGFFFYLKLIFDEIRNYELLVPTKQLFVAGHELGAA